MLGDLIIAFHRWRLVHLIGVSTLRARYARSYLGQLWLTLTMVCQILAIGITWSYIWRQPIDAFLPYYGVGQIVFAFFASSINEGAGVLIGDARYYMSDRMPFMVSVLAHLYRNFLIFLHNLPVLVLLVAWSEDAHFALGVGFVPGVVLCFLFTLFCNYAVAIVCARFRDLIQIVGVVIQNVFLLTPVMWSLELIPPPYRIYVMFNPFACILEILRNPCIGRAVNPDAYWILAAWVAVCGVAAWYMHRRFGRRLIFWI